MKIQNIMFCICFEFGKLQMVFKINLSEISVSSRNLLYCTDQASERVLQPVSEVKYDRLTESCFHNLLSTRQRKTGLVKTKI